jgi:hypothetical protein
MVQGLRFKGWGSPGAGGRGRPGGGPGGGGGKLRGLNANALAEGLKANEGALALILQGLKLRV